MVLGAGTASGSPRRMPARRKGLLRSWGTRKSVRTGTQGTWCLTGMEMWSMGKQMAAV